MLTNTIIDLSRLIHKKVTEESIDIKFTLQNIYYGDECIEFDAPVECVGSVVLLENIIFLNANVRTKLTLPCSRCFEKFCYPIDIEIHEKLSITSKDEDDEIIFIEGEKFDISDIVETNIIVSLPIQKLCNEDCKGLCQKCGTDLNLLQCNCNKDDIDPRLDKLKDLF